MKAKHMWWIIGGIVLAGAAAWGPVMSNVEQARYAVAESLGSIEIRDYDPMIVAETKSEGEREQAINDGFRQLADYIFGNNLAAQKVAMTAPVIQQSSEKIAMTAPVIQAGGGNEWKVQFVMPSGYTLETLPAPRNKAVKLEKIDSRRFAVIRFSGMGGTENLASHSETLQNFIRERKLNPLSPPVYAFFNPPWTLPFLRRNEVMIEIAK